MNLYERFFPNKEGQLETLPRKIIRHILTGDFDLQTLKRGPGYMKKWLEERGTSHLELIPSTSERNYLGYEGITYTNYCAKFKKYEGLRLKKKGAEVFDFSNNFVLTLQVEPELTLIDSVLVDSFTAVAAVTGPTAKNGMPNNGFFYRQPNSNEDTKPQVEFQHTNPVGQRRGALAQTVDGKVFFLQEQEKWRIINNKFQNISYMIGTSFYYLNTDTGNETEYKDGVQNNHSTVSCLVLATYPEGQRISYVTLNELSTRTNMKQLLDKHFFGIPYIALEMEYAGSGVLLKDKNHPQDLTRVHSNVSYIQHRIDHYLVKYDPRKVKNLVRQ